MASKQTLIIIYILVSVIVTTIVVQVFTSQALTPPEEGPCNCVGFRLDDIQDYWRTDMQISIMDEFVKAKAPATLGIIGGYMGGDVELIQYIKANIQHFELANHGWVHEDFSQLSRDEQFSLMNKTNFIVKDVFGITPVTFIAPFNEFDGSTPAAMGDVGLTALSASTLHQVKQYDNVNKVVHLPSNVESSVFDNDTWHNVDEQTIKDGIDKAIERDGYAVVVMHPNEFDSNSTKLANVLTHVKQEHRIMTLKQIARYLPH